ncbi:MAG: site-specific integrase, partial [Planctomycetota bacterium]|nr:site-specific integrase [Planctomycetota bacterium]
ALGADFDVRRIDHAAVGRIKRHLADRNLAPATICKVIRFLQGAFSRGRKLRLVTANPFDGVQLPKLQAKPVHTYKPHEIDAMIEVAPDLWWEALIRLGYTSGLRFGEMLNLTWSDVDLDGETVTVQAKRAGTFKVGDRSYPVLGWTSKSYHDRTVPIPTETMIVLQRLKAKAGGSVYVFLSLARLGQIAALMDRHGGRLRAGYNLAQNSKRRWARIQDAAAARLSEGQAEPYRWERRTMHDLRRSYGSVMAHHVPIHELRSLLGHSNIRTTERYYLAVGDDLAARVRSAFAHAVARAS